MILLYFIYYILFMCLSHYSFLSHPPLFVVKHLFVLSNNIFVWHTQSHGYVCPWRSYKLLHVHIFAISCYILPFYFILFIIFSFMHFACFAFIFLLHPTFLFIIIPLHQYFSPSLSILRSFFTSFSFHPFTFPFSVFPFFSFLKWSPLLSPPGAPRGMRWMDRWWPRSLFNTRPFPGLLSVLLPPLSVSRRRFSAWAPPSVPGCCVGGCGAQGVAPKSLGAATCAPQTTGLIGCRSAHARCDLFARRMLRHLAAILEAPVPCQSAGLTDPDGSSLLSPSWKVIMLSLYRFHLGTDLQQEYLSLLKMFISSCNFIFFLYLFIITIFPQLITYYLGLSGLDFLFLLNIWLVLRSDSATHMWVLKFH